jgi:hypothetical protein
MQLYNADQYPIKDSTRFLYEGRKLASMIDTPPKDKREFTCSLNQNEESFPRLFAAFNDDSDRQLLGNRSAEERAHLKQRLLEDVKDKFAAANTMLTSETLFWSENLPSDREESIKRLDRMEDELYEQLHAIKLKIATLPHARKTLELLQRMKGELEKGLDESVYTSPVPQPPPKKKAKTAAGK